MSFEFTFDADRPLYLVEGRPVPSVTRVLHAVGLGADYTLVPLQALERKRIIGNFVHRATQYLDEGSLDLASVDPELQPYLCGYERFLRESDFRIDRVSGSWEHRRHAVRRYGRPGRIDEREALDHRFKVCRRAVSGLRRAKRQATSSCCQGRLFLRSNTPGPFFNYGPSTQGPLPPPVL
jgi:hypothetical protein